MRINIWITKQDAISGNITEHHTHLPQVGYVNYIQVSITRDEFVKLEDNKKPKETPSVIKEYLTIKGGDFPVWWNSKDIAERQIITGYFGH